VEKGIHELVAVWMDARGVGMSFLMFLGAAQVTGTTSR
jgi:hypothetical protein